MPRRGLAERPVVCHETRERFPSISAAARSVDVVPSTIFKAIASGKPCRGYHWQYAEKWTSPLPALKPKGKTWHRARRIRCIENGMVFETLAAASFWAHCSSAYLRNRILGGRTCNGWTFVYIDP